MSAAAGVGVILKHGAYTMRVGLRALELGKATPEQQKMAAEFITALAEPEPR